jgi:hypothetical protein
MASTLVATDSLCNLQHICPQDYKQLSNHFNINQGFGPNMNGNNTNSLGHRPPEYQHQHNTSSQLFRLPPHYRPASNRYPVVMATTPDNHHQMNPVSYSPNANAVYHNLRVRPLGTSTAPVSPSTLSQGYNHNRQFSDQQICHGLSVTRLGSCPQTPQQDQRWPNIVSDGNYAYLPFSSDIPGGDASPPPNTSTNSTATNEDDHFGNSQFKNSFKKNYDNLNEVLPNKVNDPSTSGRRSAPIFGQNTAIVETKVPQAMVRYQHR